MTTTKAIDLRLCLATDRRWLGDRTLAIVVGLLLGVFARGAMAAEPPATEVVVGAYLNRIAGISLKDNRVLVDFYIWFRTRDPGLDPLETFELVNGQVLSKTNVYRKKIGAETYAICRVGAVMDKFWDTSLFPMDRQQLSLEIEDSIREADKLVYVPDEVNSGVDADVQVPGWQMNGATTAATTKIRATNYGDTSLTTGDISSHSRFTFRVEMVRHGYGQFFKLFTIMFLAVLVAHLSFFYPPSSTARIGLCTAAIFAAAANSFVINSSLPDNHRLTLADLIQDTSLVFVFLALLVATISYNWEERGDKRRAFMLDRLAQVSFPLLYLGCCAFWVTTKQAST